MFDANLSNKDRVIEDLKAQIEAINRKYKVEADERDELKDSLKNSKDIEGELDGKLKDTTKLLEEKKKPPYDLKELEKLKKENNERAARVDKLENEEDEKQAALNAQDDKNEALENLIATYESNQEVNLAIKEDKDWQAAETAKAKEREDQLRKQRDELLEKIKNKKKHVLDLEQIIELIHDMNNFEVQTHDTDGLLRKLELNLQDYASMLAHVE